MVTPIDESVPAKKPRMSTRNRVLFLLTGWLIVLMPFLFWWNTWFGRHLSDKELADYLHDDKKPRHIQQALVQIGERITHNDRDVTRWYPDALRLANYPVEEVRNTDAWVMGQDTSGAGFHEALLKMLNDPSLTVRGNAALSLVRFGDAGGRPQILELLQTQKVLAPTDGTITDNGTVGSAVRGGGVVAKLKFANGTNEELRSPISGRIRSISTAEGSHVVVGQEIATIAPDTEQVWEALRALYLIGQTADIAAVTPYERELPDISDRVRKQAVETEAAIRAREK